MVTPPPLPRSPLDLATTPPDPTDRRVNTGQLFTLALLRAGRDCAPCPACTILRQIVDEMERQMEAPANVAEGQHT